MSPLHLNPPPPPALESPSKFPEQDCASSFTKGNFTYDENDPGFKGLQRCATLCNVSVFQEDSKTDKNGPVPFRKMKVQGDGSAIEVRVLLYELYSMHACMHTSRYRTYLVG